MRTTILVVAFATASAIDAHAQLGGLKKLKEQMDKARQPNPPAAPASVGDAARVTAQIEWTIAARGPQQTKFPAIKHPTLHEDFFSQDNGEERFQYRVDATLTLEMHPHALPGGMQAKVTNGRPQIIGFLAGNLLGADRLIALNGTMSGKHNIDQTGGCKMPDKNARGETGDAGTSSANAALEGITKLDARNAAIQVTFEGDKPVHFHAQPGGFKMTGSIRYACGNVLPLESTVPTDFDIPATIAAAQQAGWVFQTTKSSDGYVLTASWRGKQNGYDIEKFGKLTWSQPAAPATPNIAQQNMAMPSAGSGSLTFTHGGKEATWKLAQVTNAGGMGVNAQVMLFTPDGQPPRDQGGMMTVGVMNMQGTWSIMALNVQRGPAGDTEYDSESNKCSVSVTPRGDEVSAVGSCAGGFKGPAISKFNFTAKIK